MLEFCSCTCAMLEMPCRRITMALCQMTHQNKKYHWDQLALALGRAGFIETNLKKCSGLGNLSRISCLACSTPLTSCGDNKISCLSEFSMANVSSRRRQICNHTSTNVSRFTAHTPSYKGLPMQAIICGQR